MNANQNIIDKVAVQKYIQDMGRWLSRYYPMLTKKDIDFVIEKSVKKRYRPEVCRLNNNYTKQQAQTTLLDMADYIMDRRPIITSWGVLFSRKGTVPNPLIKMIKSFMDLRNEHKKIMFKYPKGSEDFERYNLLQLLDKIDANGTYGVLGMYLSLYYNIHVAATVTTQARTLISSATMFFESFLANNVKFGSLDQVLTFIDNVCMEKPNRRLSDFIVLDRPITREECFSKLVLTCGFEWIPTEDDLQIIWNLVNKLDQENLNRIYYKNNIYEFMSNGSMRRAIISIMEKLEAPYMNPNEPPEEIRVELDILKDILMEYVYYPHMYIDAIDRCDNMLKSICAISDTDSCIISLDAWYRFVESIVAGRNLKILNESVDLVEYADSGDIKKATKEKVLEKVLDYDFYKDETVEIERVIDPNKSTAQDNLRYSAVNCIAYILDACVNDYMEKLSKNANSFEGDGKCLLILKNEFLFKRALLTDAKKNYATLQELQEGNIVPEEKQLDLKGLAIDKSTMNDTTRTELKKILLEDILRVDKIDQIQVIKKLAIMEDKIYKSLANGEKDYYKPVSIKSVQAYKDPKRIQGIKASVAWNALRGEAEAIDLNERNAVDIVKVTINATTAEKIKTTYPDVYQMIIDVVGTVDEPSSNQMYREWFKGNISALAIPKDVEVVPKWVVEFINYNEIINNNLCNFPLESIGIRTLGKDKVNYSNIIKL